MRIPADPGARRRLAALGAAAALAAAAGIVAGAGAGGGSSDPPPAAGSGPAGPPATTPAGVPAAIERLRIDQQVGQVLVLAFAGTEAPDYVRRALRTGRTAGVILFRENAQEPAQLRRLTGQLQQAAGGGALVSADQEGGEVRILPWAPPVLSPPALGSPAAARAAAVQTARGLRAAGVNVDLAPVADTAARPDSVMAARAYPGGPGAVAGAVSAAVGGFAAGGVAATAKHFPGLGGATENTDDQAVAVDASASAIAARDLPPFRAAVQAGVPLVMASHARYPALDPGRIASQSRTILTGLLRGRLRFGGVIVTDSMEAAAVTAESDVPTAALRSLEAGADLILTTGRGSYRPVYLRVLAEARRSPAFRATVRAAAARVLALKRSLGLPAPR
jgi:beta-N-acetylhexosaminidase